MANKALIVCRSLVEKILCVTCSNFGNETCHGMGFDKMGLINSEEARLRVCVEHIPFLLNGEDGAVFAEELIISLQRG